MSENVLQKYHGLEVCLQYAASNYASIKSGGLDYLIQFLRVFGFLGKQDFRLEIELRDHLQEDLSTPVQLCVPALAQCIIVRDTHKAASDEWRLGVKHLKAIPASPEDRTTLVQLIQQSAIHLSDHQTPEDQSQAE